MAGYGSRPKASPAERAEVERLRTEGVSIRKVAEQVFGHERYRGRVERILARPAQDGKEPVLFPPDPGLEDVDFDGLSSTALTRLLVDRTLRSWTRTGKIPSPGELRSMMDVQRRLEAMEQLERLRALTREPRRESDRQD
jgi:hypothetical protein